MNTVPITILHDPANIAGVTRREVLAGVTLADFLLAEFGADGFDVPTDVYTGSLTAGAKVDWTNWGVASTPITEPVFILQRPQGEAVVAALWYIVAAVAVSIAVVLLMPVPEVPGSGRERSRSPNNALSGRTNRARVLDRVPEIMGQVNSVPDLIAPTVSEYVEHRLVQTEYMCISRGFLDVTDVKTGETLVNDIPGSSYTLYAPGTQPAEILKTRQSNEVSGQLLLAPNEVTATGLDSTYDVSYAAGTGRGKIENTGTASVPWDGFNDGDTVTLDGVYAFSGSSLSLDGTYVVDIITDDILSLRAADAENSNWATFDGVTANVLETTGGTVLQPVVALPSAASAIGPFTVPGADANAAVWLDLQAEQGLAQGERLNKSLSVGIAFLFEALDSAGAPTGVTFSYPVTLTDSTRDARFWTYKVGTADGVVLATRYRVSAERTTDSEPTDPNRVEDIKWSRLAGIQDITTTDDTGTTRIQTTTQATARVAALQQRQFSMTATRRVVTWNGSAVVGNIETGVGLTASRRVADALLHYILDPKLAAQSLAALDVVEVYAVQAALDAVFSGEKGEFSYTFDNPNAPALEEMRQVAAAARSFLYRQGSVFSLIRDESQAVSRGLFNRRTKKPGTETRAVRFNRPLDNDGVVLEYTDRYDNTPRTITFPDDLPATDPHSGMAAAVNPLKVEGVGIRNWAQAWDRAQYEFRRQIYRRVTVDSTVTAEGALLPLNARVQHVDGTRLAALESNGEVTAVDGQIVTTTEPCTFGTGVHTAVLRDDNGDPSAPVVVTERADGANGFVLSDVAPFAMTVRGDNDYQRGTLYSFGPDGNELAEAYLVQRKTPDGRGNVRLELINYSDDYYSADDTTPPTRPAI